MGSFYRWQQDVMRCSLIAFWTLGVVCLTLSGCGLSNVGPESEKLAKWRAAQDAKTSGDTANFDTTSAVGDGARTGGDASTTCTPGLCDDKNPCTDDDCAAGKCSHEAKTGACDDDDACTTGESCAGGACTGGTKKVCDDENPCTTDKCAAATGSCGFTVQPSGSCDDGNPCTTGNCALVNGGPDVACEVVGATDCDDGNTCTDDSCDTSSGCVNLPTKVTCDDGDLCTDSKCAAKACTVTGPTDCDDDDPCTTDSCTKALGCTYTNSQAPCDDGLACTVQDICAAGVCAGTKALFESSWTGPKEAAVRALLPLKNAGFIAMGGDAVENGLPVGKIWTFAAGDPLPLTWQVTLTNTFVTGVAELAAGGTVAVGVRYSSSNLFSWMGKLDTANQKITTQVVDSSGSVSHTWMNVAAVQPKLAAAVGWQFKNLGGADGRVAFIDGTPKVIKMLLQEEVRLDGVTAASSPSATTEAAVCGNRSGAAAWFGLARVDGTWSAGRSFGAPGSECLNLARRHDDGFLAVGHEVLSASEKRATWWRLSPTGAVLADWHYTGAASSFFTDVTRDPTGSLFLIGQTDHAASGQAGLFARVDRHVAQTTTTVLSGPTSREFYGIAWHPDGYLIATGNQNYSKSKDAGAAPLVITADPWGHTSCKSAGKCAAVALADCAPKTPCTTTTCDAASGCEIAQHSGACDDGKACTAGAYCKGGVCQAGQKRLGSTEFTLQASASEPRVAVAATDNGDALLAYVEGNATTKTPLLHVQRRTPPGSIAWAMNTPLKGDLGEAELAFIVRSDARTWVGGGSADNKTSWWLSLNAAGKGVSTKVLATTDGKKQGWTTATAAPGGGLVTVGALSGDSAVRQWTAGGKVAWSTVLSTTKVPTTPTAVERVENGYWVTMSQGKAFAPTMVHIDEAGKVNGTLSLAAATASDAHYLGNLRVLGLHKTTGGRILAEAWPLVASTTLPKAKAPRLAILDADGHRRSVTKPFTITPDRVLASLALADGGALLMGATDYSTSTELNFVRTNAAGAPVQAWSPATKYGVDLAAATTKTSDGAILVATHSKHPLTGFPKVILTRMTPWGHASCGAAGLCGDESSATCSTGIDCAPGTCTPASGCDVAAASSCLSGNPCEGTALCTKGACGKAVSATDCNDLKACTIDSCDPEKGCAHEVTSGTACDDGDVCSIKDTCDKGECAGTPNLCSDGVKCTVDTCKYPNGNCTNVASAKLCNDGNDCSVDACDAKKGCQHSAVALGSACGASKSVCTGTICHPPFASYVTVGEGFACSIGVHGYTSCWGRGQFGQLGSGKTDNSNKPLKLNNSAYDIIAAGDKHVCGIRGGFISCWGDNSSGQCGGATPQIVLTPTLVKGTNKVKHIAAGKEHSCAIDVKSGALWCWGASQFGETGIINATGQELLPHKVSQQDSGLKGVTVGTNHTCVITSKGGVRCMGSNVKGQIGNQGANDQQITLIDVLDQNNKVLTGITQIEAGPHATWALQGATGATFVWGTDAFGHKEDVSISNVNVVPIQCPVTKVTTPKRVAVALAADHMCHQVKGSGAIQCAGKSHMEALGLPKDEVVKAPITLTALTSITQFSVGTTMSCAVRVDGAVLCWGKQENGSLGGTLPDEEVAPPTIVVGSAPK